MPICTVELQNTFTLAVDLISKRAGDAGKVGIGTIARNALTT